MDKEEVVESNKHMISKWLILFVMGLVMLFTGVYVFPNPFVFRGILGITGIMLMFIGLFVYIYKEAEKTFTE